MKPTQKLHDLGQSLWLDNITRELLNSGTLQALHRRALGDGAHLEPDDLRSMRSRTAPTYDADISRTASTAKSAEDLFFELALADLTRAADLFQPVFARTDGVDGWVSLEVSPLLAHDTQEHARGRARSPSARRQAQPLHQDSRHPGRPARHRGGDLRRRAGQRHAAVLARAICRGGRSLPARRRAAHRGGPEPGRRLGGLALRQPLGRRGRRQGSGRAAPTGSASPSPSAPTRPIASCSPRRASSAPPTPAPAPSACCGPAPAPRTRRPPTPSM